MEPLNRNSYFTSWADKYWNKSLLWYNKLKDLTQTLATPGSRDTNSQPKANENKLTSAITSIGTYTFAKTGLETMTCRQQKSQVKMALSAIVSFKKPLV